MGEHTEHKPSRHITEFADIPRKIESIFDPKNPPHVKDKFIDRYLEARETLDPDQLRDFELHLKIPCQKCADRVQNKRKLF